MTDQLNGAWGARLLYGEPVGPIPSELSHGSGVRGITCLHRRIRVALYSEVSKDFCGTYQTSGRLSTRRSAEGFKSGTSGVGNATPAFSPRTNMCWFNPGTGETSAASLPSSGGNSPLGGSGSRTQRRRRSRIWSSLSGVADRGHDLCAAR